MVEPILVGIVIGLVIISVAGLFIVALGNWALSARFKALWTWGCFSLYVIGELVFPLNNNAFPAFAQQLFSSPIDATGKAVYKTDYPVGVEVGVIMLLDLFLKAEIDHMWPIPTSVVTTSDSLSYPILVLPTFPPSIVNAIRDAGNRGPGQIDNRSTRIASSIALTTNRFTNAEQSMCGGIINRRPVPGLWCWSIFYSGFINNTDGSLGLSTGLIRLTILLGSRITLDAVINNLNVGGVGQSETRSNPSPIVTVNLIYQQFAENPGLSTGIGLVILPAKRI